MDEIIRAGDYPIGVKTYHPCQGIGIIPAMEPMLTTVPFEAMRRGANACVTAIRAKTFRSKSFLAVSRLASSNGAPYPILD